VWNLEKVARAFATAIERGKALYRLAKPLSFTGSYYGGRARPHDPQWFEDANATFLVSEGRYLLLRVHIDGNAESDLYEMWKRPRSEFILPANTPVLLWNDKSVVAPNGIHVTVHDPRENLEPHHPGPMPDLPDMALRHTWTALHAASRAGALPASVAEELDQADAAYLACRARAWRPARALLAPIDAAVVERLAPRQARRSRPRASREPPRRSRTQPCCAEDRTSRRMPWTGASTRPPRSSGA
jgi:hypothetical protein